MEKKARSNLSNEKHKDWISNISDDILIKIISQLTLKDAIRTSVLSHKWENLYRFFTGDMDFEMPKGVICAHHVNRVLNSHQGESIRRLRVASPLDIDSSPDIDKWIDLARTKKAQRLELDLHDPCGNRWYDYPWNREDPRGRHYPVLSLKLLRDHPRFDSLTYLSLKFVKFSEEVVTYFLSNCPLLEHLSIHHVHTISQLRISGANLKLKQLEIIYCHDLNVLKISAPKLIDFKYKGNKIEMQPLQDAPLLSSLTLAGTYCEHMITTGFEVLGLQISQLERLILDVNIMTYMYVRKFPDEYREFSNLKQLEIEFEASKGQSILFLTSFVRAAPRLCKITLKINIGDYPTLPKCPREIKDYRHENLKVVEFLGWVGTKADYELAMYLLKNCVSLEKMVIDPQHLHGLPEDSRIQTLEVSREWARDMLPYVPQGAELIIL